MKIVAAYKWAPNPQDAVVSEEGTIDWSRAKASVSEYDPVAMELARQLADDTGGEVVGVTVGPAESGSPMARKAALARRLDRLVLVADDALGSASSTDLAAVIAAVVRQIGDVDLVLTGDASVDTGDRMVPALLGGFLGWPALADVASVSRVPSGFRIERLTADGTESLEVAGPAVLAVSASAVVPRVPGMKDILAAGKKPVEVVELSTLDLPAPGNGLTVLSSQKAEGGTRQVQMIDATDPDAAATELLAALRAAGSL